MQRPHFFTEKIMMRLNIQKNTKGLGFLLIYKIKINCIHSMDQNKKQNSRLYENEQVVSNNCCNPFMRISTSTSIDKLLNSQKSSRASKERGIQLTHKTKSYSKLVTSSKLIIKKSQPLKLNQKVAKKQQNLSCELNLVVGQQIQKKSFLAKKCIDYKNKKIQQHKNENMEYISLNLQSSKKEECSTMRNTARTINSSSFGALLFDRPNNSSNNISIQHSYFLQHCKEEEKQESQPLQIKNTNKQYPKKTLQKVFEETQGRRIVTLQSQISNEESSNQYSEAQSYDFPYIHS